MRKLVTVVVLVGLVVALVSTAVLTVGAQEPEPTVQVTPTPEAEPIEEPAAEPVAEPAEEPVVEPTEEPVVEPTEEPVVEPTEEPPAQPVEPAAAPIAEPEDVGPASPAAWGGRSVNVQIQNVGTALGTVLVEYVNTDGSIQTTKSFTLPVGSSRTLVHNPSQDDAGLPASWQGSAVASSDQPIVALFQSYDADYSPYEAAPVGGARGAPSGAMTVTLPMIQYNWYGNNSEMYIQNAGSGDADVTVSYVPGVLLGETSGASGVTDTCNGLAAKASCSLDQSTKVALGAPSGTWSGRFLGSAVVTADEPVVAVVNQNQEALRQQVSYEGFTSAGRELAAPAIFANFAGGNFTSLVVQNTANITANVTITYTADTQFTLPVSKQGTQTVVNFEVGPQAGSTRYEGSSIGDVYNVYTTFVGIAVIAADQDIVAKVDQSVPNGDLQTYSAVDTDEAGYEVVCPLVQWNWFDNLTSITIQNQEDVTATVTITYTPDAAFAAYIGSTAPTEVAHEVPPLGQKLIYEGADALGDLDGQGYTRFIGGATLASDKKIVAIVGVAVSPKTHDKDTGWYYNGFNQ